MKSNIRVILAAKDVPQDAIVQRFRTDDSSGELQDEFKIRKETILNGASVQLPDTELCLEPVTSGRPAQIIAPETEVVALLTLEQVKSIYG